MKLFVTGGTGFIGHHFVQGAIDHGHQVVGLLHSRPPAQQSGMPNLAWVKGALDSNLNDCLSSCDVLVHFAAHGVVELPSGGPWDACFYWNVFSSVKLWRAAVGCGIKRFLICGSCFEYGRSAERYQFIPVEAPLEPTAPYAASKAAASIAAHALAIEKNLHLAVLRPFQVFGEGEHPLRLWPSLRSAALAGGDFPMTPSEQVRDFVPAEHVVNRFLEVLSNGISPAGQPVVRNIGTGRPQTVLAFAEYWWKHWGATGQLLPGKMDYRPNEVMRCVPQVT